MICRKNLRWRFCRGPTRARKRRGAVAVEFALISFVLFLVLGASFELCRALMCIGSLEEAARAACRVAILGDSSPERIRAEADKILAPAGISKYNLTQSTSGLGKWQPVTIQISAPLGDLTWLPTARFVNNRTYTAYSTLAREFDAN